MPRVDFCPSVFCGPFSDEKADLSFLGFRRRHKLADSMEQRLNVFVVALNRPLGVQNGGQHDRTIFRKGMG